MDTDLAKSLEQLEMKKKAINAKSDLTKECKAIIELNHRIALLLKDIKNLRDSIDEQSAFICDNCDQLEQDYRALERASSIFELTTELTKLNRICRRIDSNQIFKLYESNNPEQLLETIVRRASLTRDNEDSGHSENDELTSQILNETIEKFEAIYRPLEGVLSQRKDLPYVSYANKIRQFKQIVVSNTVVPH